MLGGPDGEDNPRMTTTVNCGVDLKGEDNPTSDSQPGLLGGPAGEDNPMMTTNVIAGWI